VALAARGVGGFFTSNFENVNERVPSHFVLDAECAYEPPFAALRRTRLQLQVHNVFDRLYVLQGEGDQFFPAATRNFFAGIEFGL
jgi:iron complex outermembrane receptor protein